MVAALPRCKLLTFLDKKISKKLKKLLYIRTLFGYIKNIRQADEPPAKTQKEIKMKYAINLVTYAADQTAQSVVSAALGFDKELSHGSIVDIFAKDLAHKDGVFTSKKRAQIVADRINARGAFGGFSIVTIATVVAA